VKDLCQARRPGGADHAFEAWRCTRPRGHAGDHIAAIGPYQVGEVLLAQWPAERERDPTLEALALDWSAIPLADLPRVAAAVAASIRSVQAEDLSTLLAGRRPPWPPRATTRPREKDPMTDHDQDAAIGALSRRHSDAKRKRAALMSEIGAVKAALEEVVRSLHVVTTGGFGLTSETAPRMLPTYPDPARVAELLRDLSASCHELEHTQQLLREAGVDVS
jgi:hypothetical protein